VGYAGKQLELAKLLLEEGCSAGARNATTHSTPLHVAVKRRSLELVNLLLEYGADPLVVDQVRCGSCT
jgi:ankyrin repeat protein